MNKPCKTCGRNIIKARWEGKTRWEQHSYCSLTCRPAWNKGLTKDDKRVAKYLENSKGTQFKRGQTAGRNNVKWKGDNATYAAKHMWIRYHYGGANMCESDDCSRKSKNYHWSNVSGLYKRDRKDWQQLCVPCHKIYDLARKKQLKRGEYDRRN